MCQASIIFLRNEKVCLSENKILVDVGITKMRPSEKNIIYVQNLKSTSCLKICTINNKTLALHSDSIIHI